MGERGRRRRGGGGGKKEGGGERRKNFPNEVWYYQTSSPENTYLKDTFYIHIFFVIFYCKCHDPCSGVPFEDPRIINFIMKYIGTSEIDHVKYVRHHKESIVMWTR